MRSPVVCTLVGSWVGFGMGRWVTLALWMHQRGIWSSGKSIEFRSLSGKRVSFVVDIEDAFWSHLLFPSQRRILDDHEAPIAKQTPFGPISPLGQIVQKIVHAVHEGNPKQVNVSAQHGASRDRASMLPNL